MPSTSDHTATFSLRLTQDQRDLLAALAKHQNTTVATLARSYVVDGIRRALDPAEITRRMEEEKEHLLRAAEEMRASVSSNTGSEAT